jgi:hypothetical protein
MGLLEGLDSIKKHQDELDAKRQAREEGTREKTKFFGISDGESVKVRFLQELDKGAANYSEKNGLGFLAVEHSNPENFKRKALCTLDEEGNCWACDTNERSWKSVEGYKGGWKQKTRLYINALVDDGTNEPYVVVLSQGNGPKSVTPTVIEYATETGSITNRWFKVKRTGSGLSDTSYSIIALGEDDSVDPEKYDLYDLKKVVWSVPSDEQEAHYLNTGERQAEPVAAVSASAEW